MKIGIIALLFLALTPTLSWCASFDCAVTNKPIEKIICSDQELSTLDEKLNQSYQNALLVIPDLQSSQISWLSALNECTTNTSSTNCLKDAFRNRIQALDRIAKPNIGTLGIEIRLVQINNQNALQVNKVMTGGSGYNAGITSADFIIEINNKPIINMNQVLEQITLPPGELVRLKLIKQDNSERVIQVRLGSKAGSEADASAPGAALDGSSAKELPTSDSKSDAAINSKLQDNKSSFGSAMVVAVIAGILVLILLVFKKKRASDKNFVQQKEVVLQKTPNTQVIAPIAPHDESIDPTQTMYERALELLQAGSLRRAGQLLEETANRGHLNSQYQLGKLMLEQSSDNGDSHYKAGIAWMKKAASLRHPEAQLFLNSIDKSGDVAVDKKKSKEDVLRQQQLNAFKKLK